MYTNCSFDIPGVSGLTIVYSCIAFLAGGGLAVKRVTLYNLQLVTLYNLQIRTRLCALINLDTWRPTHNFVKVYTKMVKS